MILNRQKRARVVLPSLEKFVRKVKRELRLEGREMSICLVSDAEMTRLNKKYRKQSKPTDVLSFPSNDAAAFRRESSKSLGDIAIAPKVARRNAKRFGRTLPDELRILILHGVLHLMGYDHERDGGQMERRERHLRRRLGLE